MWIRGSRTRIGASMRRSSSNGKPRGRSSRRSGHDFREHDLAADTRRSPPGGASTTVLTAYTGSPFDSPAEAVGVQRVTSRQRTGQSRPDDLDCRLGRTDPSSNGRLSPPDSLKSCTWPGHSATRARFKPRSLLCSGYFRGGLQDLDSARGCERERFQRVASTMLNTAALAPSRARASARRPLSIPLGEGERGSRSGRWPATTPRNCPPDRTAAPLRSYRAPAPRSTQSSGRCARALMRRDARGAEASRSSAYMDPADTEDPYHRVSVLRRRDINRLHTSLPRTNAAEAAKPWPSGLRLPRVDLR